MNNKIKYCLFSIIFFFLFIMPVKADTCNIVEQEITAYHNYDEQLKNLDCTDVSNLENVNLCNDLTMQKNLSVIHIMQMNDNNGVCSAQKADVDQIIEENSDNCGKIFGEELRVFVNTAMTIFYILGPVLLILFGSLDYTKAVISSDQAALKKANKDFVKRLTATILLILTPMITNFIISFNLSDYYLSGEAYSCDFTAITFNKEWKMTPVKNEKLNKLVNNINTTNAVSPKGQAIADAAKQIKTYIASHKYSYNSASDSVDVIATDSQKTKNVVCATLVAVALYRAQIYDKSTFDYGINSAPSTAEFLNNKGWTIIKDKEQLQPGDVVFYYGLAKYGSTTPKVIDGKTEYPGHVEIFAGKDSNGVAKVYNTGGNLDEVETNFSNNSYRFIFAFRYPGE